LAFKNTMEAGGLHFYNMLNILKRELLTCRIVKIVGTQVTVACHCTAKIILV